MPIIHLLGLRAASSLIGPIGTAGNRVPLVNPPKVLPNNCTSYT